MMAAHRFREGGTHDHAAHTDPDKAELKRNVEQYKAEAADVSCPIPMSADYSTDARQENVTHVIASSA